MNKQNNHTTKRHEVGHIVAGSDDGTLIICPRDREEMIFRFANDVELKKLIDRR